MILQLQVLVFIDLKLVPLFCLILSVPSAPTSPDVSIQPVKTYNYTFFFLRPMPLCNYEADVQYYIMLCCGKQLALRVF